VCPWHVQSLPPFENLQLVTIRKRANNRKRMEDDGQQRLPF
jgi:hypothetical protein